MKLAGMISPLPWGWIFLARSFMPPFLCFPAKNRNCIKTLTILRPSSKQNYLIRLLTIVNTVIRSLLWCHPLRFNDRPCIFFGGEEPEIIEILPFRSRSSEPSKQHDLVVIDKQESVSPSWRGYQFIFTFIKHLLPFHFLNFKEKNY